MVKNNGSVSASGTARAAGAMPKLRAAPSAAAAFQLFLRQRRRTPRNSTSPSETDSNIALFGKSLAPSVSESPLNNGIPSSLARRVKPSDITSSLILHRHLADPVAASKLTKLYKRHRNLERSLALFLLRRQLWRRTRKPTFRMDFIENLRRIQADAPSSDEESGIILTAATVPASRRQSPSSNAVLREQLDNTKVAPAKRKRDTAAAAASPTEVDADAAPAAKKPKVQPSSPAVKDKVAPTGKTTEPAGQATLRSKPSLQKRSTPDSEKTGHHPATNPRRDEPGTSAQKKPTPAAPSPSQAPFPPPVTPKPALPLPLPPATTKSTMELFERRVHEMLTDPLGFDDCVHDTQRPTPRHVAKSFARYRSRQTQPPPPLVMSGALGVGVVKKGAGDGGKGKAGLGGGAGGSQLAREATKRAHREGMEGRVHEFRGKGKGKDFALDVDGKGKGFGGGKQAGVANRKVGKGKVKERAWLTNARQNPGVQQGGEQRQGSVRKYTR